MRLAHFNKSLCYQQLKCKYTKGFGIALGRAGWVHKCAGHIRREGIKLIRKFLLIGTAVAALALMPARANAALLTLLDGTDVWTLDVQTGCTVCDITLSVTYRVERADG